MNSLLPKYSVIFLDIDGVMNSDQYNRYRCKHHKREWGGIDPRECHRMARFCKKYNIKLVISSSWRNGNSWEKTYKEFMNEGFEELPYKHHGMKYLAPYIIGVTPYCESRNRGEEIKAFFDIVDGKYPDFRKVMKDDFEISSYCIVDDDNDMLENQMNNFVQTDPLIGLTRKNYDEILWILYRQEYKKCREDFEVFKKYIKGL